MTSEQMWAIRALSGGGLFFFCIGALLLIPVRSARRFRRSAVRSAGTVVRYDVEKDGEAGTRYDPVVAYRDGAGIEQTTVVRGTRHRTLEPGQAITVLHHPNSPRYALIAGLDGYRDQEWGAFGFMLAGALTFLVGIAIWVCRIPITRG